MNRRRIRRRMKGNGRGHSRRNSEMKGKLSTVVIIICLSVAAGYLTATYIIGPMLGLDTAPLVFNENGEKNNSGENSDKSTESSEKTGSKTDTANKSGDDKEPDETEGLAESGYVLQYGSFSSEEAAKNCINDLKRSGIQAEILEKDGAFKVVSPLFDTEQDARAKMEKQKNVVDVFITQIP